MRSLGERLAVAYGWEREVPPGNHVRLWLVGDPVHYMTTPNPENSWQDFGAMLEWAQDRGNFRPSITGILEEVAARTVLSNFRRAVTEAILEALDV